ncbi:PGG domain - like 10 [Theobroma cacao]|nr:PGG domain - like 10 [Theobroma cacao]
MVAASDVAQCNQSSVDQAIFNAAQLGITEFIVKIIKPNLDLLMIYDQHLRNIFQIAIAHRQEKENYHLNLSLSFNKSQEQLYKCKENYNGSRFDQNNKGETPYEAFDRSHAELVKEGEKWMKDIAQSSTVVGTLIITIMFAALFTVPGGPDQDTGVPLLLKNKPFKVFIISDANSLFASTTSVLIFVGILTSRYTADDFLKSLPNKLIIGLSSLFISIATMMVAFSSTVIIMVKGQLEIVIPIVLLAGIPIGLFVWLQFPLLVKIFISTYGPGIFDRKMKWV